MDSEINLQNLKTIDDMPGKKTVTEKKDKKRAVTSYM